MANLPVISGADGYIALLNGTSTAMTGEACSQITQFPGGSVTYPIKQVYQITARTKKVIDMQTSVVVYNNAVAVKATDYILYPGAGIIYFRTALTGTPVITIDGAYLPTATATDVLGMLHVNNWQLNLTGNQIDADEYGKIIAPQMRGKLSGTWQFDRHASSTGIDLFNYMQQRNYFVFALYESLNTNRLWITYGDLTSNPISAPGGGVVSGTVNGVLREVPSFLNEAL